MSDLQELTNELMQVLRSEKNMKRYSHYDVFDPCKKGSGSDENRNQSGGHQQTGEWHKKSQPCAAQSYC